MNSNSTHTQTTDFQKNFFWEIILKPESNKDLALKSYPFKNALVTKPNKFENRKSISFHLLRESSGYMSSTVDICHSLANFHQ